MRGRGQSWLDVPEEIREEIRSYLMSEGAEVRATTGPTEIWRVKLSGATLICYRNGTVYSTPSQKPVVTRAWDFIEVRRPRFVPSDKTFLIGLDETGKGELVGHLTLVGALVPGNLMREVQEIIGLADTKTSHPSGYWDALFADLDTLRPRGLDFVIEKIPPSAVDRYKLNDLLDVTYAWILDVLCRRARPETCRIVVDDYGVGSRLRQLLETLKEQHAEIVVAPRADDRYLEAKVASVLAKRAYQRELAAIRGDKFLIGKISVGSGMASDERTLAWLRAWKATGRPWPSFVKRSTRTVAEIDSVKPPRKVGLPSGLTGSWKNQSVLSQPESVGPERWTCNEA
jgi:ribonuclease HII